MAEADPGQVQFQGLVMKMMEVMNLAKDSPAAQREAGRAVSDIVGHIRKAYRDETKTKSPPKKLARKELEDLFDGAKIGRLGVTRIRDVVRALANEDTGFAELGKSPKLDEVYDALDESRAMHDKFFAAVLQIRDEDIVTKQGM